MTATALLVATSGLVAGPAGAQGAPSRVVAVGAENQYADVIGQIGGPYVKVHAVMRNPNTDPHEFESSPRVAEQVAGAKLIVQNGLGYDTFMTKMEQASPSPGRRVIDVQHLLRLPGSTPNPHLWYDPNTMPAVAAAVGADLGKLDPAHRAYFEAKVASFDASLRPWKQAISILKRSYGASPVATTEPVADYLLGAAGLRDATPFSFQADVMNGTDPSPQAVAIEQRLLTARSVKAFVYNEQVTDPLTQSLLSLARQHHVPVVGVYETMPTPGYHYQSWMLAETRALARALASGASMSRL